MTALAAPGVRRVGVRRLVLLTGLVALVLAGWAVHQRMPGWYARMWYPLRHEQVIRTNADRQRLDPALVAAVVDTESSWVPDSTSRAGAVGLMQLMPDTARFIATQPNRPSPPPDDLTDPQVNIAYGTWYLRYLIDAHGSLPPALASYNAGERNVRRWEAAAAARGQRFDVDRDVPFPETRDFVHRVLRAAEIYRRAYPGQLGEAIPGLAVMPGSIRSLER